MFHVEKKTLFCKTARDFLRGKARKEDVNYLKRKHFIEEQENDNETKRF